MFKIALSLLASSVFLSASQQLVLVMAEDVNHSSGILQRYEKNGVWRKVGPAVSVMLGRNGLGYAEGKEPLKFEGDGRTPAGKFSISAAFGYDDVPNSLMPYLHADEHLICVDDANDPQYNRIVIQTDSILPKSFEWMRRQDEVYRNGAVIDYNRERAAGRGSCIFIHLNHPDHRPTSGCTAMDETPLKELLGWLDPQKRPIIVQIPRCDCAEYQKEFDGIECE